MTESEKWLLLSAVGALHVILRQMIEQNVPERELRKAQDYLGRAASEFLATTPFPTKEPAP